MSRLRIIRRSSSPDRPRAVLGIDASYTGFAVCLLTNRGRVEHVLGKFPGKSDWTTAQRIQRLLVIESWLFSVLDTWYDEPIEVVALEGYARNVKQGREESGELSAVIRQVLMHRGHIPAVVAPTAVKKFAAGSGAAKKSDMKLAVYKRWGFETDDDNVADAFALAKIALALCEGPKGLIAAQQDVLKELERDGSWRLARTQLGAPTPPRLNIRQVHLS